MAFGMTIRRALSTTSCDQRFHDFESLVNCIRPESRFTTRTPNVRKVCTGVWRLDSGLRHTSIHSHTQHTDSRATRLERTSLAHTDSVAPIVFLSAHSKTRPARSLLTHPLLHPFFSILSLASRHSTDHTTLLFTSVPAPLHTHIASDGLAFFEISISFPLSAPLGALVFRASCVRGREAPCQNAPQGGR